MIWLWCHTLFSWLPLSWLAFHVAGQLSHVTTVLFLWHPLFWLSFCSGTAGKSGVEDYGEWSKRGVVEVGHQWEFAMVCICYFATPLWWEAEAISLFTTKLLHMCTFINRWERMSGSHSLVHCMYGQKWVSLWNGEKWRMVFVVSGSNEKSKRKSDMLLRELYYEMRNVCVLIWCMVYNSV